MTESLTNISCSEFAAALAAKNPVPGGGGAAAYAGALAAALCSMVGNYTMGKKAYAAVEPDVQRMLDQAEGIRERLLGLVDADAQAFEPLSRAYGIPRSDPQRDDILEAATKGACKAPLAMMRELCTCIDLLDEMGVKGSKMLASDVACGALLARAALETAAVNVFVNTRTLKDRSYAELLETECDTMLASYSARAEEMAADILAGIRA